MHGISIKEVNHITNETICMHSDKIENIDSSYLICQDCGTQLQQIFRSATGNSKLLSAETSKHEKNKAYEFIDNCISRLNLPNCMSKEIFNHFMKMKEKNPSKNFFHLASYSIYDYLIRNEMGRNLEDIINVTKVKKQDILKCSSLNECPVKYNDLRSILENVPIISFKLSEKDRWKLISISHEFLEYANSPYSIAAALTKIYCSTINKKIGDKILSKHFKISAMSIFRAKKLIEKQAIAILETSQDLSSAKNHCLWSNARQKIFDNYYSVPMKQ